ncbi:MAG: GNAT family N-acetyltransferase [bacterium]
METSEADKKENIDRLIKRADISDLQAIQKLNAELCEKENREFDETINPEFPFSKGGEEYFRARIEREDGFVLVIKEGENAVGYLVGGIVEPEDYRSIIKMAELENMYVQENLRGQGLGGKLVDQFESWCKGKGVTRIRVIASAGNSDAIKFYEAHGSKKVSITLEKDLG